MKLPQAIIIFIISAFAILVGLPLWWNTTKVYRATLPFSDISSLQNEVKSTVSIHLHVLPYLIGDVKVSLETLKKQLIHETKQNSASAGFGNYQFGVEVTECVYCLKHVERLKEIQHDSILLANEFEEFDEYLSSNQDINVNIVNYTLAYQIYILTGLGSKTNSQKHERELCQIFVGKFRNIIFFCQFGMSEEGYVKEIVRVLQEGYIPELNFDFNTTMMASYFFKGTTSIQSAPGYQLCFTLANVNPHDFMPYWNIKDAIESHLQPFLSKVSFLGPFSVTSQVLHFVDVGIRPKKKKNDNFYSNDQLALLINPIESRLGSYTSNNPMLHFVVYLPPKAEMPLFIQGDSNERLHDFSSPRWGGVLFYNVNSRSNTSAPLKVDINMDTVMPTLVSQLREHLGIRRPKKSNIIYATSNKISLFDWELNLLLISRTLENLKKSITTLHSLAQLLEEIANIVISDDVKGLIENSLGNIRAAKLKLKEGSLLDAFHFSKIAFVNSEKAFYDPSLLALLYFPDDQKYAIYMPLFLPISVPIILSLIGAIRWMKYQSRGKEKDD